MLTTMRNITISSMLAAATILTGCATSSGPRFSALEAVQPDKSSVYVYRNGALFASGQAFTVNMNGKPVGQLYNASYQQLHVAPGKHALQVAPGGFAQASTLEITAEPGKTYFYEYDFVTGLLANVFFIGAKIEPRDQTKALADLKELNRAE
jgi:hypothetical protein